jgi:hypothetical protein
MNATHDKQQYTLDQILAAARTVERANANGNHYVLPTWKWELLLALKAIPFNTQKEPQCIPKP